ncbi:hypothetical protein [Profundibacter sp.]|uniref:hypothetical protein n=1 Tax=Profundibacter sp. TaxID=3101071 RepID=UPI003D0A3F39
MIEYPASDTVQGMVKVSEIKDRDSLEAWLLDRPEDEARQFALILIHRAAMRVLPYYWEWVGNAAYAKERNISALRVLHGNLVSGVARTMVNSDIKEAAEHANRAANISSPNGFLDAVTYSAYSAAKAAAYIAGSAFAVNAIDQVGKVFVSAADVLWGTIRLDSEAIKNGDILLTTPLWNGNENPFQAEWEKVRGSASKDWSFWINWYQDALEGREPDWDMLEEIALIPDEDWQKGPEHINNEVIAGIVEKYAKKRESETSINDTAMPSKAEQKTIAQKVADNREALAFSIAGVLEQIAEYRERVRKLNSLEPEYKEGLLEFLDRLSKQFSDLLGELPDEGEVVSEEKTTKLALWWREYKALIGVKAKKYVTPDNLSEATVPAGIILGCAGIGAIFGPVGATAGGVVGSLITGQIKPGKAAGELMKDFDAPDSSA